MRMEGLVVLIGACAAYLNDHGSWSIFAVLFFTPDLSMIGFLVSKKVGTIAYNAFHTYSIPILIFLVLFCVKVFSDESDTEAEWSVFLEKFAIIWMAHIGFDRMLGYGIKYETAFKDTHLQRV